MAKSKEAAKEGQQEGKSAEPKKKGEGGGNKTFVMMFAVAMIVQLIIIVILVYFVLKNNSQQSGAQPAVAEKSAENAKHESDAAKEGEKKDEGPIFMYQTDDLIINPKGSGGKRYLMTQVGLSVINAEVKKEFEESRKAQIYDILSQYLANRSVDQLADIEQRDSLKIDLKKTLNKEIAGNKIKNVFFSKFVVQ